MVRCRRGKWWTRRRPRAPRSAPATSSRSSSAARAGTSALEQLFGQGVHYLRAIVHHLRVRPLVADEGDDAGHHLVGVALAGGHAGDAERDHLPAVVVVHLGDGDVELVVQPRDERLDHAPLVFERVVLGQAEPDAAEADGHAPPPYLSGNREQGTGNKAIPPLAPCSLFPVPRSPAAAGLPASPARMTPGRGRGV